MERLFNTPRNTLRRRDVPSRTPYPLHAGPVRRALAPCCGLLLALWVGCSPVPAPCGGCTGNTVCDPIKKICGQALAPGQNCLLGDGGATDAGSPLPCAQGTACLDINGENVCATACDPSVAGAPCPNSAQACAALTTAGGGRTGICMTAVGPGQACGTSLLSACESPANCVVASGQSTGRCFEGCNPTDPASACTAGSCLSVFVAADAGLCATPVAPGQGCAEQAFAFCPAHQICLQPQDADAGACAALCDPTIPAGCPELQHCLTPDGVTSLCAQPQPLGGPCDPNLALFCDNGALCVQPASGPQQGTCDADCSGGQACPAGKSCLATVNPAVKFCG